MNQDYILIAKKLNNNPLRVPRHEGEYTETFIEYLTLLNSPEEAAVVKLLTPLLKFTATEELLKNRVSRKKQ